MVSNVLFDLDGTLTDPGEGITKCLQYALEKLDQPYRSAPELTNFIGPPLHTTFREILNSSNEDLVNKAVCLYRERFSKVGLFENKVYPGIAELLSVLHESLYKLYVVTVKPKVFAERIVRHFSLDQWLEAVFGSSLDDREYSKLKIIGATIIELKLVPKDTILVGDRKEDVAAGRASGMITIGVTYGYGTGEEIIKSDPDYICDSPLEIQQTILSL
jgi:phosphoglycolate phosphatase